MDTLPDGLRAIESTGAARGGEAVSRKPRLQGDAIFSEDRVYRYRLTRGGGNNSCTFIMLNPSTADEMHDDPTVRRCWRFTKSWGYERLIVVNLFAYRSSSPQCLRETLWPIGPENDYHICEAARESALIVCAWGNQGRYRGRSGEIRQILLSHGYALYCLRQNRSGQPIHPLYVPADLRPHFF